MPQLPVSSAASQLIGAAASASPATSSAIGAEGGGGLAGGQGPNFGAVLSKQLKGIVALLEGREVSSLSGAPADKTEVGDSSGSGAAPAIFQLDLSALSALASQQASELPQSSAPLQASMLSQASASLLAPSSSPLPPAKLGLSGRAGALSFEAGSAKSTSETSRAGDAKLAAEIAGNGKNLPQILSPEDPFSQKLAAFVDGVVDRSGPQVEVPDMSSVARHPAAGVADAAMALRQPEQLPALTVAPKVGSVDWGGAVGEKVLWMANQNSQVAELHLNPPNLGPLEVRLTVTNDQASAIFVSHHSAVRDAIETALPRLREMLADNGIMLGNASVGSESFSQQQQASDQRGGGGKDSSRGVHGMDGMGGQVAGNAMLARDGMVDIFA